MLNSQIDGMAVTIDETITQDYRVFELMADISDGDKASLAKVPWLARRIFGRDQWEMIVNHIAERDGIPTSEKCISVIMEAFVKASSPKDDAELKN